MPCQALVNTSIYKLATQIDVFVALYANFLYFVYIFYDTNLNNLVFVCTYTNTVIHKHSVSKKIYIYQ